MRSFTLVCVLAFVGSFLGGCVPGHPQNQFVVYNNTNVLLEVKVGGYMVEKALQPSQDVPYPRTAWVEGQTINVTATAYDEVGPIGVFNQDYYLTSGYNGTPFQEISIVVDSGNLQQIRNAVPDPKNRPALHHSGNRNGI